jgi:hypothetical protein
MGSKIKIDLTRVSVSFPSESECASTAVGSQILDLRGGSY